MTSTTETVPVEVQINQNLPKHQRAPLQLTGALDQFESFDVTPVVGREFPEASLKEWLEAPNSDELIRELAVTSMH